MSQLLDLKNSLHGNRNITNFHKLLFDLILRADNHNLELLRKAFPNAVIMAMHRRIGGIEEKTPDLPYD